MNTWYLNRLKTMSLSEFFFRVVQFFQKKGEQYFLMKKLPIPEVTSFGKKVLDIENVSTEFFPDTINIFGKEFNYNKETINWHEDIFSGQCFPMVFSKNINIRANPNLSAKNVWEINRLQFLPQIALNFKKSGADSYLNKFIEILSSWINDNPYLKGINWYSNIEVNIRLINWFFCWEILNVEKLITEREDFRHFVQSVWIPSIYQHCLYSFRNPSRFSSANNHLIAEYAGLYVSSSLWKFKDSDKWLKYAKNGLEKEILLQHSSGINREEAAEYIQFITDFFLLSFIVGENTNVSFSKQYKEHLYEIFNYIFNFLDCNGNFPKYGDEDDGKCFTLGYDNKFNNFKSLLTSGAVIFKDPRLKSKSNGFDLKNWLLLGDSGKEVFKSIAENIYSENSQFYKNEGHFIFRKKENRKEIYLHFDAAPLGFLSIAAHGHADALSFILHVDGHPVFIDSGTYTYHTDPEWRHYFIGTLAHNTIRINNKDQAVNGGPTLWTEHYKTKISDANLGEDIDSVKASHNGYLSEKAEHIREILFDKSKNEIHITDTILIKNDIATEVEIPFHFHPDVKIMSTDKNCFLIYNERIRKTVFYIDEKLNPTIIKGQRSPQILGWYSESFMKKESTNVIYSKININCTTTFKYVIKIN